MAPLTYEVVDGKATWGGLSLAAWVPLAIAEIVAVFDPVQIVLFGSVGRGDDDAASDIDLLVVVDRITGRRHDLSVAVQRSLDQIGAPVDVLVADLDDVALHGKEPGILRVALREGSIVHQRVA